MGAVEDAAMRLEAQVPERTVYRYGLPDGNLAEDYLIVYGSDGSEESNRMSQTVNILRPTVWVVSVSRDPVPFVAARQAAAGASRARRALRNFRPHGTWSFRHVSGDPSPRKDMLAGQPVYVAGEQFTIRNDL